ncbi:CHAT domain-containing protein [Aquisphaera insulae]|uniref:CHAT domain-containing protein n=1 Tax=Aquisphaera insulae TaxID=2712864 RepID=UPI00202FF6D5|nr:CHAT domain-containing protein [Aquisphaera insulae]
MKLVIPNRLPILVTWSGNGEGTHDQLAVQQKADKEAFGISRHFVTLPGRTLEGNWSVSWEHGRLLVESRGERWIDAYLPGELTDGPTEITAIVAYGQVSIARFELRSANASAINAAGAKALRDASEASFEASGLVRAGRPADGLDRARRLLRALEAEGLEATWPGVYSRMHLLVAEAALLAGAYTEVAPEAEASLTTVLTRCGPAHPRTHVALTGIDRLITALLDRVVRNPTQADANASLADLSARMVARLGPNHWLARSARVASQDARGLAGVNHDSSRRLVQARDAGLQARVHLREGKFSDAATEAGKAVALARSSGLNAPLEVVDALTGIGLAQAAQHDGARALASFSEASSLCEEALGAHHPRSASTRNNLGVALLLSGRYRDAAAEARNAYLARAECLGRHDPGTWQALRNLGEAERLAYGKSESESEFRRSLFEAAAMIESGAHDAAPDSADYQLAAMSRSPAPILTFVAVIPVPMTPSTLAWPQAAPISLLEDPNAFELGRARVLRRMANSPESSSFVISGTPQPISLAQKSTEILTTLLGEDNPWTILSWLAANRNQIHRLPAVEKCTRAFGPEHPATAIIANNRGVLLVHLAMITPFEPFPPTQQKKRDALASAEKLSRLACRILQTRLGERHPQLAAARFQLGIILYHEGLTAEARELLETCVAADREALGSAHPELASAINTLGTVHYRSGRYPEARVCVEEAMQLRSRGRKDRPRDADSSLNDLGVILRAQGDLVTARRFFETVLRAIPAGDITRSDLGRAAAQNLSTVLIEMGDFSEARRRFGKPNDSGSYKDVSTRINLGTIALVEGDDTSAERLFREVIEFAPNNHVAVNSLGVIARKRGDIPGAIRQFEQSLEGRVKSFGAVHPETALCRVSLGIARARNGEFEESIKQLTGAAAIYRDVHGSQSPQYADTLRRLGIVLVMAGRPAEAMKPLEESLRIKRSMAEDIVPTLSEAEALAFVATLTERDPALTALRLTGSDAETAYHVVWSTRAMVSRALAERKSLIEANPTAAAQLDRLRATRSQLSALTLYPESIRQNPAERKALLESLTETKERLERELARNCEGYRKETARLRSRFTDLAHALSEGVAVVDFVRYLDWSDPKSAAPGNQPAPRFAAFVLRNETRAPGYCLARVELGPASPIDRDIATWRSWIQAGNRGAVPVEVERGPDDESSPEAARSRLREKLWTSLEPHLAGARTVVIIPDGSLTRLPWPALSGRSPGRYLIEDIAIATATSGQQILAVLGSKGPDAGRVVLMGGAAYDVPAEGEPVEPVLAQSRVVGVSQNRWTYLPGTTVEVERIAAEAPAADAVTLLRSSAASEPALGREIALSRFAHLATHGFFTGAKVRSVLDPTPALDPADVELLMSQATRKPRVELSALGEAAGRNPLLLSGLVCAGANQPLELDASGLPAAADGILTAEEVASLNLRATDLVVLSACETGLGDVGGGEGVFGLQRAFHLAGVRTTVASLWKVDDVATRALMVEFYRNLWHKKLGRLEALRQAQIAMLHRYDAHRGSLSEAVPSPETTAHGQDRKTDRPHLGLWAAFVLNGDWR